MVVTGQRNFSDHMAILERNQRSDGYQKDLDLELLDSTDTTRYYNDASNPISKLARF